MSDFINFYIPGQESNVNIYGNVLAKGQNYLVFVNEIGNEQESNIQELFKINSTHVIISLQAVELRESFRNSLVTLRERLGGENIVGPFHPMGLVVLNESSHRIIFEFLFLNLQVFKELEWNSLSFNERSFHPDMNLSPASIIDLQFFIPVRIDGIDYPAIAVMRHNGVSDERYTAALEDVFEFINSSLISQGINLSYQLLDMPGI